MIRLVGEMSKMSQNKAFKPLSIYIEPIKTSNFINKNKFN